MSDNIALTLKKREVSGKKLAKLRAEGQTPGVIYGHGMEPINVQAAQPAMTKVATKAGKHHLVDLDLEGKKHQGIIKSIDIDPVKHVVQHVAFHIVRQNEKIETSIPIKLVGEGDSDAERAGLVVLQTLESLVIRALPKDLPDSLEVDITKLAEAGQTVTIGDLTIPKGVDLVEEDMAITIANVYEPGALQAANEASGGDAESVADVASENGTADVATETDTK